jgi:hypothetical protein
MTLKDKLGKLLWPAHPAASPIASPVRLSPSSNALVDNMVQCCIVGMSAQERRDKVPLITAIAWNRQREGRMLVSSEVWGKSVDELCMMLPAKKAPSKARDNKPEDLDF